LAAGTWSQNFEVGIRFMDRRHQASYPRIVYSKISVRAIVLAPPSVGGLATLVIKSPEQPRVTHVVLSFEHVEVGILIVSPVDQLAVGLEHVEITAE
jgi:hypothetical protein